jgi:hypothetical protein
MKKQKKELLNPPSLDFKDYGPLRRFIAGSLRKGFSLLEVVKAAKKEMWSLGTVLSLVPRKRLTEYELTMLFIGLKINPAAEHDMLRDDAGLSSSKIVNLCIPCSVPPIIAFRHLRKVMDMRDIIPAMLDAWGTSTTTDTLSEVQLTLSELSEVVRAMLDQGITVDITFEILDKITAGRILAWYILDKKLADAGVYVVHRERIKNQLKGRAITKMLISRMSQKGK